MTKQTTIVVTGAFRVKQILAFVYYGSIVNNQPKNSIEDDVQEEPQSQNTAYQ